MNSVSRIVNSAFSLIYLLLAILFHLVLFVHE